MKLEWHLVRGTQEEKPESIDKTSSPGIVYIRKDIERIEVKSGTGETVVNMWNYYEAELSAEEYEEFNAIKEAVQIAATNDGSDTTALMEAQAQIYEQNLALQENQTAIMEAIATLYEGSVTA